MASKIVKLNGDANGTNRTFTTPTKYVADTLRLIWNGNPYEPDDDKWGWNEIDDSTIELITAPRTNDTLQAYYQDKDEAGQIGVEGVVGSPFHPNNTYP